METKTPKKFLIFQGAGTLKNFLFFGNWNLSPSLKKTQKIHPKKVLNFKIEKFLIFQEMKLSASNIKKFLIFFQKKTFIIFQ